MPNHDTILMCEICGRKSSGVMESLLRNGWERCCDVAMTLHETDPAKVNEAMKSMNMKYNVSKKRWDPTYVMSEGGRYGAA